MMLKTSEQLKLAQTATQPCRAGALDQRLLRGPDTRLVQRGARPVLVALPVAPDQRGINAPVDTGLASPRADRKAGELTKRDQQLRRVHGRKTAAVHLVIERRDLFQFLPEPAPTRGHLLADSGRRDDLVRVHQVTLALAASWEQRVHE